MSFKKIVYIMPLMFFGVTYGMNAFDQLKGACRNLDVQMVKNSLSHQRLSKNQVEQLRRLVSEARFSTANGQMYYLGMGRDVGIGTLPTLLIGLALTALFKYWATNYYNNQYLNELGQPVSIIPEVTHGVSNIAFYTFLTGVGVAGIIGLGCKIIHRHYRNNLNACDAIKDLIRKAE